MAPHDEHGFTLTSAYHDPFLPTVHGKEEELMLAKVIHPY